MKIAGHLGRPGTAGTGAKRYIQTRLRKYSQSLYARRPPEHARLDSLRSPIVLSTARWFSGAGAVSRGKHWIIGHYQEPSLILREMVGDNNPEHFNRTFRRLTGMSPAQYRNAK